MKVTLTVYQQSNRVDEVVVHRFPSVIGRGEDADITLDDRWASRKHCKLEICRGVLVVDDLNSKHGTRVNDRPVQQSPLLPGESLGVGLTRFVAHYASDAIQQQDGLEAACNP